ncbi:hypothetical protein GIB67_030247 [Kingdonia uniflora]|uniref:Uncharacterized protein n=1 Tax=Kingdonia uniflora TaxID=39325 RepID=A0A7J7MN60_9MAGN|nr:hypothetical protein GIB67_030247 [Kingdonia uniflora]
MICGTNYATCNYSIGGADTEDIDDVYRPDMSGLVDEDEHLEDIEENQSVPRTDSTSKRSSPTPPLEKRQHGTRVKKTDKLEELLEDLSGTLSGLHASIDHGKRLIRWCSQILVKIIDQVDHLDFRFFFSVGHY